MRKRQKGFSSDFKRGNVFLDTITWIVVLFVMIIAVVFGKFIFSEVNTTIQADDFLDSVQKDRVDTLNTNYAGFFDKVFLFVLILMVVLVLVASFMIDAHPVFFIVSIILFFVVMFIGALLSNAYQELGQDTAFSVAYVQFPIINFVTQHFIQFIVFVGFGILLALFGKNRLMQ